MWPFSKSSGIEVSGMLKGFTDWHSHLLPGVDDGFKTMESTLEALEEFDRLGVRKVWLTPHIMEDMPNTTAGLRQRFEELKKAWSGNVELALASENMLDSLFQERLAQNDFLPLGEEGRHLLVETSYFNPPMDMDEMLEGIKRAGYFPVLAHPERYRYMEEEDYRSLKERGILFQVNMVSLAGGYGDTARKKAEWLLQHGMADLTGSDMHRLENFRGMIAKPVKSKDAMKALQEIASNPVVS